MTAADVTGTPTDTGGSGSEPAGAPEGTPAAGFAPSGPGALLRQARERAGFGLEDLAAQLKLARNTLEALERDDFSTLSEAVYVRGYYRKIAKVLPVSEAELIGAYEAQSRPKSSLLPQRIPLAGGVAAGSSRQSRGQGVGLIAAVAVLFGALFLLADEQPARRLADAPEPVARAAPAPAEPAPIDPAPSAGVTETPSAPVPDAAPVAAPDSAPAPATGAAAPAVPAAGPTQLVLEFGESSFVRVEDSRNKTLAIGLVRGGERQLLDGQPPYTVFLGNAQNVKVFYNNQAIDFSPHVNRQNDTARFTVP